MRIDRLDLRLCRLPLVSFFETSFGRSYDRTFLLARVEGDGHEGWGEAVAEAADDDGQHPVAGGEAVDDGGLHGPRPGAREQHDVTGGADQRGQPGGDLRLHLGELGAAVVDHRCCLGLAHLGGDGGRPGDAQVLFHGPHHNRPVEAHRCRASRRT